MNITNLENIQLSFENSGTREIISCQWCAPDEIAKRTLTETHETIPQGQGSPQIRKETVKWLPKNMDVLSLPALRKHKDINETTYRILWSKLLSHAFSLDGYSEALKTYFSAFNETFTLPALWSSFKRFAEKHPELISPEKRQAILSTLQNAVWHDNITEEKIKNITDKIQDPSALSSILIGTGWDWHSTQIIFFKFRGEDFFIYCNRGAECEKFPGWRLFKINKKDKMTPQWVKDLAERLLFKKDEYVNLQEIKLDLGAEEIHYCRMKQQTVGNCTYTNMKAAIFALLFILELEQAIPAEKKLGKDFNFDLLADKVRKSYKPFADADRQMYAEDLLIDLKDLLKTNFNSKNAGMEGEVVRQVAQEMHTKLCSNPTFIYRLGYDLWKELFILSEKLLKSDSKGLMNAQLLQFADRFKDYGAYPNKKLLLELGHLFLTKEGYITLFRDPFLYLLFKKGLLGKALKSAGLLTDETKPYYSSLLQIDLKGKIPPLELIVQRLCDVNRIYNDLNRLEKATKLILNESARSKAFEELFKELIKVGLLDRAAQIAPFVSDPWRRAFISFTVAKEEENQKIEARRLFLTLEDEEEPQEELVENSNLVQIRKIESVQQPSSVGSGSNQLYMAAVIFLLFLLINEVNASLAKGLGRS